MDENVTLSEAAPVEGQPAEQAVEGPIVAETVAPDSSVTPAPVAETAQEKAARRWAGKYNSPEELESGYLNTTAETTRLAQEVARLKGIEEGRQSVSKTDTPEGQAAAIATTQLESYRERHMLNIGDFQARAAQAEAGGDMALARDFAQKALHAASSINVIDRELRQREYREHTAATTKQTAEAKIINKATGILTQYASSLQPGNELYVKASDYLDTYISMGYPNNAITQANAVAMAVQELGLPLASAEQATRKTQVQNINQALKAGVVAGAGKASSAAANPDYLSMSKAEFVATKKKMGLPT